MEAAVARSRRYRRGLKCDSRIVRRRAEPGWRAAVLDERASRHVFRLRGSEEGSGHQAPASASGANNEDGGSSHASSSASDDEVGGRPKRDPRDQDCASLPGRAREQTTLLRLRTSKEGSGSQAQSSASGASKQTRTEQLDTVG